MAAIAKHSSERRLEDHRKKPAVHMVNNVAAAKMASKANTTAAAMVLLYSDNPTSI